MGQDVRRFLKNSDFVPFDRAAIESTIPEAFARQLRVSPDRLAVRCPQTSFTYRGLDAISNRIAHGILDRLGRGNEPVALLFGQGSAPVAAILGALKAGKTYVALDPAWPLDELRQIVLDCRPRLIVAAGENRRVALGLAGSPDRWLDMESISPETRSDDPRIEISPDDVCYIYYTSGTTGTPKGVYDSHRNVLHNVMRYTNSLGIGPDDRLSLIQSPAFSGTVSTQFSALMNGASLFPFALGRRSIGRLADWIVARSITIFHSVPAIFQSLVATGRTFHGLRIVRLEGDRAERRHIALFQEHFDDHCVLVNGLGATETGLTRQFFVGRNSTVSGDVVPVGYPTDDMIVQVIDDDGNEVSRDEIGEIAVTSPYLALGYWNRTQQSALAFAADTRVRGGRTYRTGDLGRMRRDNCLEILGRKDSCSMLRGRLINTPMIEAALRGLQGVAGAVVMVRGNGSDQQQLVAYIVPSSPNPAVDAMRRALAESLPSYLIPNRYVFLDALPLDRHGKVDPRQLPEIRRSRPPLQGPFVPVGGENEEAIAACFRDLLRIDTVGSDDDFFDLGGDSLLYTELLSLIAQRLGIAWWPPEPGERFTVSALSRSVNDERQATTLVSLRAGGSKSALFCMHNHPGNIREYRRLATRLTTEMPVYGLQRVGDPDNGFRVLKVEDHAGIYAREILALQHEGPVHVCGNCFDGVIAFEVARQVRERGGHVGKVILIDTAFPANGFAAITQRLRDPHLWHRFAARPLHEQVASVARIGASSVRAIAGRLSGSKKRIHESGSAHAGRFRSDAVAAHNAALGRYTPGMYDGEITLICPGAPHNQRGWVKVAGGGLYTCEVPIDPAADSPKSRTPHLTAEPYLTPLAALIDEILGA